MKDAALESALDLESRVGEHAQHAIVVGHDVRIERLDMVIARDTGEHLEHSCSDTATLQRVGDRETHFGAFGLGRIADIRRDAYETVPRLGHEDDNSQAIAFLLSPQASFINGEILNVDGGIAAAG